MGQYKILHTAQQKKSINSITAKATGAAYLVLVILTDEKYTANIYTIVSDDPIITEAHNETKLSAPYFSKRPLSIAIDALPDNGLVIIKGMSSDGMPIFESGSVSNSETRSSTPDTSSIRTLIKRAHNVGISENELFTPCSAPSRKNSK